MDIRPLSDTYAVSPQIDPQDVDAIKAAGFKTVLCNRPDTENPPDRHMSAVQTTVEAAGLTFVINPFDSTSFGPEAIAEQKRLLASAEAPVLAYCATGNRCSVVWAFTQAGTQSSDDIIAAVENAGYQLSHMKPQLDGFAGS